MLAVEYGAWTRQLVEAVLSAAAFVQGLTQGVPLASACLQR